MADQGDVSFWAPAATAFVALVAFMGNLINSVLQRKKDAHSSQVAMLEQDHARDSEHFKGLRERNKQLEELRDKLLMSYQETSKHIGKLEGEILSLSGLIQAQKEDLEKAYVQISTRDARIERLADYIAQLKAFIFILRDRVLLHKHAIPQDVVECVTAQETVELMTRQTDMI